MVAPWRTAAALALATAGDRARAGELIQAELAQARAIGAPRRLGIALRAAGTISCGRRGLEMLHEAVAVLERSPAKLEHARALVEFGALLRREGQRIASREQLRRGFEPAHATGARPLANRAEHELHAAGGRRRPVRPSSGPAALTPTERRIAELAASGLSNPQIASTLYVTAKTIDWHLGNAYRKQLQTTTA